MAESVRTAADVIQVDAASTVAVASAIGTELPNLRSEGERLKLERDNAQLRAEFAALTKPWWRKSWNVTTLTAIVAAVVPVTTAVEAHYGKERELALQESKQAHEIRTNYLDRLEKPGAKLRTLRFVLATTTDPVLKDWARDEAKVVQAEIGEMDRKISLLEQQIAELEGSSTDAPDKKLTQEERLRELELKDRQERLRDLKEQRKIGVIDPYLSPD
jgi:hypothetical protein